MLKDCKGRKSVMAVVRQSGISHSTIATILKNTNKVKEAIMRSASLNTTKSQVGSMSDMEKLSMI